MVVAAVDTSACGPWVALALFVAFLFLDSGVPGDSIVTIDRGPRVRGWQDVGYPKGAIQTVLIVTFSVIAFKIKMHEHTTRQLFLNVLD